MKTSQFGGGQPTLENPPPPFLSARFGGYIIYIYFFLEGKFYLPKLGEMIAQFDKHISYFSLLPPKN